MHFSQIQEILLDDSFYRWYLQTDESDVLRWNEWRLAEEKNRQLLEEAVSYLHTLLNQKDEEGFPKRVHAIHSRLQRAKEVKNQAAAEADIPPNRASLGPIIDFDINLS